MRRDDARPKPTIGEIKMPFESPWLNAKEAAIYVRRTAPSAFKTMLLLARAGKIKAGHDGKTFRFKAEDLDSWLYLNGKKTIS